MVNETSHQFPAEIVRSSILHTRLHPVKHEFKYPVVYYILNLTSPPKSSRLFGMNHRGVLSFRESDFLQRENSSLLERVKKNLANENLSDFGHRVMLVTNLRLFGYVFNPVSFYFCYNQENTLGVLLAEVNNTFGEKHLYVTRAKNGEASFTSSICKDFHVSPFYDRKGEYKFRFKELAGKLDVSIDLYQDNQLQLHTRVLEKTRKPFCDKEILITLFKQPLSGALTFPRIVWQAFLLRFRRGLPVYTKPNANSSMTLRINTPTMLEKFAMRRVFALLTKLKQGEIKMVLPEGKELSFGDSSSADKGRVVIRSYATFVRTLFSGDIGFGDAYVDGDWDTLDLGAVLRVLTLNLDVVDDRSLFWSWVGRVSNIVRHFSRFNSVQNSRSNIKRHYDLSNDLFGSFLDRSMTYSCAIFKDKESSLEDAQQEKIRELISKAELKPTDKVLEIGCGWGSFAIKAAKEIGCHVTAITLSEEQKQFVEERVQKLGLNRLIEVKLLDYRKLEGSFDKIVSIEMIEAVGHKYYGMFFKVCDKLLKPGGKIVIQAITIPDQRYTFYRFGCDWIQRHIFPGGSCPSLAALSSAITKDSSLVVNRVENFGAHYALTLSEWRSRFLESFESIRPHGFDDKFKRLWIYYLTYCEEGFTCKALDTLHLVLERPGDKRL